MKRFAYVSNNLVFEVAAMGQELPVDAIIIV